MIPKVADGSGHIRQEVELSQLLRPVRNTAAKKLVNVHSSGLHIHATPVRASALSRNEVHAKQRELGELNVVNGLRHGHGLIELMRIRSLPTLEAGLHGALGEAIRCLGASAISGQFGHADLHLNEAIRLSPTGTCEALRRAASQLSSSAVPVNPGDQSIEQIGAQALAGIICARLLPHSEPSDARTSQSLHSMVAAGAAQALMSKLADCGSKEQVRELLDSFVGMFSTPAREMTAVGEVRVALAYCDAFDAEQAGHSLSQPSDNFPLVEARALEDTEHPGWGAELMA